MKVEHKTVAVEDLHLAGFRSKQKFLVQTKLDALERSIEANGWWPNVHVRPRKGGGYEAPYGAHRLAILKKVMKGKRVEVMVADLTDAQMVQFWAAENVEDMGADAMLDVEVMDAVMDAFEAKTIDLADNSVASVATFLGWVTDKGKPNGRCEVAYRARTYIKDGMFPTKRIEAIREVQGHVTIADLRACVSAVSRASLAKTNEAMKLEITAKQLKERGQDEMAKEVQAKAKEVKATAKEAAVEAVNTVAEERVVAAKEAEDIEEAAIERAVAKRERKKSSSSRPKDKASAVWAFTDGLLTDITALIEDDDLTARLDRLEDLAKNGLIPDVQKFERIKREISKAAEKVAKRWQQRAERWAKITAATTPPIRQARVVSITRALAQ